MATVLALGPVGTNGHEAASRIIHSLPSDDSEVEVERIYFCGSHHELFQEVLSGHCFGVVPIENSINGLVADTIHGFWLKQHDKVSPISVFGEVLIPIEHVLAMRRGRTPNKNTQVLSHPQAIGQCRENLQKLGLNDTESTKSTAGAAEIITKDELYADSAALVSPFAAEKWGLEVIKRHMEDAPGNTTRFHVIGHKKWPPCSNCKTALIFWTEDKPRALVNALWAISAEVANMTSVHSIPLGIAGLFAFYVEFDEHVGTTNGIEIMNRLKTVTERILCLGSFPKA